MKSGFAFCVSRLDITFLWLSVVGPTPTRQSGRHSRLTRSISFVPSPFPSLNDFVVLISWSIVRLNSNTRKPYPALHLSAWVGRRPWIRSASQSRAWSTDNQSEEQLIISRSCHSTTEFNRYDGIFSAHEPKTNLFRFSCRDCLSSLGLLW